MDQVISESVGTGVKKRRSRRPKKEVSAVSQVDSTEARLSTHEQVCSERYKALETRMDSVEKRMDAISADVKELKQTNDRQFNEIKALISSHKDEKFKVMVTAAGTVVVALLGVMGYLITHLK